jgi:recombining binding protein suppressor of hairless
MPEIDLVVKALQDTMSAAPPVVTPVDKREAGGDGEVSEDEVLQSLGESAEKQNAGSSAAAPAASGTPGAVPPASAVSGRSLPLLFIRPADGIGYHSGRSIVCENIMQNLTINALGNGAGGNVDAGWIAAAQVAASSENNYAAAWNLRVV